jgi:hypothetical protein
MMHLVWRVRQRLLRAAAVSVLQVFSAVGGAEAQAEAASSTPAISWAYAQGGELRSVMEVGLVMGTGPDLESYQALRQVLAEKTPTIRVPDSPDESVVQIWVMPLGASTQDLGAMAWTNQGQALALPLQTTIYEARGMVVRLEPPGTIRVLHDRTYRRSIGDGGMKGIAKALGKDFAKIWKAQNGG